MLAPKELPKLTGEQRGFLQKQLQNKQITLEQLEKMAHPSEVEKILKNLGQKRGTVGHDAAKIIDDITKSEKRYQNALENVRRNPQSAAALKELEEAEKQLEGIRAAQDALRRRPKGD